MWLRLDHTKFIYTSKPWLALIIIIPLTLICFTKLGLYKEVTRYITSKALLTVGVGTLFSANFLFIVSQLFLLEIPRSVPFIFFFILFLTISGLRSFIRLLYQTYKKTTKKAIAIYGAGESGIQLLKTLEQNTHLKPVLFIDDNQNLQGLNISGLKVFSFEESLRKIKELNIKAIFISMPSVPTLVKKNIINKLEEFPIEIKALPGMNELIEENQKIKEIRSVTIEELLGRDPVPPLKELMSKNIKSKTVLITGAGGSIGSEISRLVCNLSPKKLIILDISEFALYKIHQELEKYIQSKNYTFELYLLFVLFKIKIV